MRDFVFENSLLKELIFSALIILSSGLIYYVIKKSKTRLNWFLMGLLTCIFAASVVKGLDLVNNDSVTLYKKNSKESNETEAAIKDQVAIKDKSIKKENDNKKVLKINCGENLDECVKMIQFNLEVIFAN